MEKNVGFFCLTKLYRTTADKDLNKLNFQKETNKKKSKTSEFEV